jgi:hypothetical protein
LQRSAAIGSAIVDSVGAAWRGIETVAAMVRGALARRDSTSIEPGHRAGQSRS